MSGGDGESWKGGSSAFAMHARKQDLLWMSLDKVLHATQAPTMAEDLRNQGSTFQVLTERSACPITPKGLEPFCDLRLEAKMLSARSIEDQQTNDVLGRDGAVITLSCFNTQSTEILQIVHAGDGVDGLKHILVGILHMNLVCKFVYLVEFKGHTGSTGKAD
ncbi:hypothetical protein EI94DRAFT_1699339 [Lactarius quietus]|nr:hypothetical protein EI94DRAFT_1699339 [Lactarius quietus]